MRARTGLFIIGAAVSLAGCGLADPPPLVAAGTPASACEVFKASVAVGYAEGYKQTTETFDPRPGEQVVVVGPKWAEMTAPQQTSLAWNIDCVYGKTTSETDSHLSALRFRASRDGPDLLAFEGQQLETLRPLTGSAPGVATPTG